jgi:hypothetical protein
MMVCNTWEVAIMLMFVKYLLFNTLITLS